MHEEKGFVLLITLSTLFIITLLLLSCMQQLLLYHKVLNQSEQNQQRFYQLEHVALQLAELLNKECFLSSDNANKMLQWLMDGKGCLIKTDAGEYRFILEKLGEFPCLLTGAQKRPTVHFRISVLRVNEDKSLSTPIIQLRFIKQTAALVCKQKPRQIAAGISSWRYFADYTPSHT